MKFTWRSLNDVLIRVFKTSDNNHRRPCAGRGPCLSNEASGLTQ
ncbi:hypothetical protein FHS97_003212 [Sphingomonas endophytica]|uniref:Transposase n=1 Tax=Sphingomonas endophytica TaxID=869719 RepID=A0ABR6NC22_9SPHN|nr:hypothetical protein [Sphingomonas endophytica]